MTVWAQAMMPSTDGGGRSHSQSLAALAQFKPSILTGVNQHGRLDGWSCVNNAVPTQMAIGRWSWCFVAAWRVFCCPLFCLVLLVILGSSGWIMYHLLHRGAQHLLVALVLVSADEFWSFWCHFIAIFQVYASVYDNSDRHRRPSMCTATSTWLVAALPSDRGPGWSLWASRHMARRLAASAGVELVDECEEDRPPSSFRSRTGWRYTCSDAATKLLDFVFISLF